MDGGEFGVEMVVASNGKQKASSWATWHKEIEIREGGGMQGQSINTTRSRSWMIDRFP